MRAMGHQPGRSPRMRYGETGQEASLELATGWMVVRVTAGYLVEESERSGFSTVLCRLKDDLLA